VCPQLPNVLVLTYPKTGSTSLHAAFVRHPEIGMPNAKETFYFSNYYHHGKDWYAGKFKHCSNYRVRCDFASTLMHEQNFVDKINQTVPNAKFIVLLRDPVKRCISHYLHELRRGLTDKSFEVELKKERQKIIDEPSGYSHFAFKSIGDQYKENAENLVNVFGDERIRFVLLEQLVENSDCLRMLYDFIGVSYQNYFPNNNRARMPKKDVLSNILRGGLTTVRKMPTNRFLNKITPQSFKVTTRKYRQKIDLFLKNIEERKTYIPIEKNTIVSSTTIKRLEHHYRMHLKGFDKTIKIDLKKYWPWYGAER